MNCNFRVTEEFKILLEFIIISVSRRLRMNKQIFSMWDMHREPNHEISLRNLCVTNENQHSVTKKWKNCYSSFPHVIQCNFNYFKHPYNNNLTLHLVKANS